LVCGGVFLLRGRAAQRQRVSGFVGAGRTVRGRGLESRKPPTFLFGGVSLELRKWPRVGARGCARGLCCAAEVGERHPARRLLFIDEAPSLAATKVAEMDGVCGLGSGEAAESHLSLGALVNGRRPRLRKLLDLFTQEGGGCELDRRFCGAQASKDCAVTGRQRPSRWVVGEKITLPLGPAVRRSGLSPWSDDPPVSG